MPIKTVYSNQTEFIAQDNPFFRFLRNHPIRVTVMDNKLYCVARDFITALGYSQSSVQHLTDKCQNKVRVKVLGSKCRTTVNLVPILDVVMMVIECPSTCHSVTKLRAWLFDHAASQTMLHADEFTQVVAELTPEDDDETDHADNPT